MRASGKGSVCDSLTFVRLQDDPAPLGSDCIVRLAKVDPRRALRVVADCQLPGRAV